MKTTDIASHTVSSSEVHSPISEGLPTRTPDFVEQDYSANMDNVIPTRGYQLTPMVALGGSAGSISVLQEFFRTMPEDSGMVFVVILHLARDQSSTLADLLARCTKMPVVQAVNRQKVLPNHVYVIPPGKELATIEGHLLLSELHAERGKRVVVDLFFRSLADSHGPHGAALVISGADGDGALGIKRIKERGGLTVAQDPNEAEHAGMPTSAIETGMVDWVLPIAQMPQRLLNYFHQEKSLQLPPEEGPQPAEAVQIPHDQAESALREVLVYLRTRTGRDFSYYKRATILRRIARRMQVNTVDTMPAYLAFLRTHPGEAGALLQDLLISVTNFFRDRDAFAVLEQHIPQLFEGKGPGEPVRVWVPACATGEEAYSIAILLLEHARTLDFPPILQVFACDLDEEAVGRARAGFYPDAMVADVSEDRVRKFFVRDHRGYRVRREVREMVLFAAHDLLKDAPFSRMDLISCRNLLIYLNRGAQKRVFETFHFASKPGALLFLGTSESVEETSLLYRALDKKNRLYVHQPAARVGLPVPLGPVSVGRAVMMPERIRTGPVVHGRHFAQDGMTGLAPEVSALDRASLAEFHFKLVERLAPPSVVVSADHDIVHLSESAGRYLKFVGGEPTNNLLRLVDPMIRVELRAGLFRAVETNTMVSLTNLPMQVDGQASLMDIRISPASEIVHGFLLVIFDAHSADSVHVAAKDKQEAPPEPLIRQLERELEQVKTQLYDTVEQYEASTEEMKASNEELQAMNEELRSATEELETSREELQSINEELATVNAEMKGKVDELANANSDLQNLMGSTAIATVFLDRELAITRYTPSAVELFHLIPTDVGRALENLKYRLDYPELISDAEKVLRTLVPVEREVQDESRWFLARLQPYRTVEDHIAGIVLTFVDITERRAATEALREQVEEVTRFNRVAVGRETRMIELKQEINELLARLGESARYRPDAGLEAVETGAPPRT